MDSRTARSTAAAFGAPHPFRRTVMGARGAPAAGAGEDLKLFALSFTAFFVCFYTFLL